jgi:hypothetical protein
MLRGRVVPGVVVRFWVALAALCTACGDATGPGAWLHAGAELTFAYQSFSYYNCDPSLTAERDDALCGGHVVEVLARADTIHVHFVASDGRGSMLDVSSTYGRLAGVGADERYVAVASGTARLCTVLPAGACEVIAVSDSIIVLREDVPVPSDATCRTEGCPIDHLWIVTVGLVVTLPSTEGDAIGRAVGGIVEGLDHGAYASDEGWHGNEYQNGRWRTEIAWTLRPS